MDQPTRHARFAAVAKSSTGKISWIVTSNGSKTKPYQLQRVQQFKNNLTRLPQ
jgi:hypothetical protein